MRSMTPHFFGQEIEVTLSGEVKVPISFRLGDLSYEIIEILEMWHDRSFGKAPLRRKKWWQRHHRTYYKVRTTSGEIFELYYDRGASLTHPEYKKWILHRQL